MDNKDKIVSGIMQKLDNIEYGFCDDFGYNIINNNKKWNEEFYQFYYLLNPEELLEKKCGVCWDQVELERFLFEENRIEVDTYFIFIDDKNKLPSHTFLTYCMNNKYYWFEHSWNIYKGIHEYNSIKELLLDVKDKFIKSNDCIFNSEHIFVYKYCKPKSHIKCLEFYDYIETQKLIKLNNP